ncbi:hypothetical protein DPQ33_16525 [Oceanidesulfovibrio indonesiensis]|uniref:Uncharacterized protein n=1 Tax=Oceanidesulfovibrio indonesiensis TaxID=54767 RepID=A0A7M3MAL0_9BACT|nr:hypothetical protein [Oceanidesulfovibrio indonesiensis]TVM14831.1 hypothetical protein DPQ33_16525 [Oceanidesulfovibrio indonesiensis]
MRSRKSGLLLGVMLLVAAAFFMVVGAYELWERGGGEPDATEVIESTEPTPEKPEASSLPPEEPETWGVPGPESQPDLRQTPLDPIADFARYIAERHRAWRGYGGEFLPARELAALYGLDVYALPEEERPPSPGITPVALKLGYFVVAERFVKSLVAQGDRLRPLQEQDLMGRESAGSEPGPDAVAEDAGRNAWTRDLLESTADKARQLAACREGNDVDTPDCRFARAFMAGLAGPEMDADRLQAEAASVLLDLAGKLEARAAAQGGTSSPHATQ